MAACHHWCLVLALLIVRGHSQLGNDTNGTVSTATVSTVMSTSVVVTPTPTATSQPIILTTTQHAASTSASHVISSSTKTPSPTPTPVKDFFSYTSNSLYLKIQNISIGFSSPTYTNLTGASINKMGFVNNTYEKTGKKITLTRFYGSSEEELKFFIRVSECVQLENFSVENQFIFEQNTDGGWSLQGFQHANLQNKSSVSVFFYTGIQTSIWAPAQLLYTCDGLTLHGSNGHVTTSVSLMNISAQPFLSGGHVSKTAFNCAGYSENNQIIGLAIGLSLSLAVVIAVIVIIVSLLVSRRHRGYNILEEH